MFSAMLWLALASDAGTDVVEPATPQGSPGQWVTAEDYPATALRAGHEGVTSFILTIDPQGVVADCQISGTSGDTALDDMTCKLLRQRARFAPARDKRGKSVTSAWRSRIRWAIPANEPPLASHSASFVIDFDMSSKGEIMNCVARDELSGREAPEGCATVAERKPPMTGRPIHVRMRQGYDLTVLDTEPVERKADQSSPQP